MAKTWEEMTPAEKVEDLRRDVIKTMQTVNAWVQSQQTLGTDHNRLSNLVSEVAKAVEQLEKAAQK